MNTYVFILRLDVAVEPELERRAGAVVTREAVERTVRAAVTHSTMTEAVADALAVEFPEARVGLALVTLGEK